MKRSVAWAGLGAVLAVAAVGCSLGETRRDVGYGVDQPVKVLVVQASTGDVEVVGGGSAVTVTERQEYRGKEPQTRHEVADGTLTLSYRCNDCSVGYRVQVPEGTEVRVQGATGDVKVSGLAGPVDAQSSTGSVLASGLRSGSVRLVSSTGDVRASFAAAPAQLTATTSTGDVRLTVPGGQPYAVDAGTGTGKVQVDVDRSAAAGLRITAQSSTGDVTVSRA